ncbi:MAG: efflux RND transporter periplasmic adaptor subunit [Deltaproteobacteria bacterium]|jgi:membrane fusion protein (multidrug efflux system)|nr:efflux RND transporter periplasmic adaptor subunit [Deltaproteobacteria bacterium]
MKRFLKKSIFVLIPLIIVGLAALVLLRTFLAPRPQMPTMTARVTLFEIKETEVKNSYETVGRLEPNLRVDLAARVSGILLEKSFKEGARVKEGDVLFAIEADQYEAALDAAKGGLLTAEAQLKQARLNHDRTRDLFNKRTVSQSEYDDAKAVMEMAEGTLLSAKAQLSQAELNLAHTKVKAPFDGTMSDSPFSAGALVGPTGGVLATIVSTDPVEASFGLSDRLLADLRFGAGGSPLPVGRTDSLVARVKINGEYLYPGEGHVAYVSPTVDKATSTVKIKTVFPNPDGLLIPGETAVVILEDSLPRKTIIIPKNSLLQSSSAGSFVYVAAAAPDGAGLVAEMRPVTQGREFPEGLEILEGLSPGDKIVNLGLMSGGSMLRPGSPVAVDENYVPVATSPGAIDAPKTATPAAATTAAATPEAPAATTEAQAPEAATEAAAGAGEALSDGGEAN